MRTKNLLKLALTMVAMLTITAAWAQDDLASAGGVHDTNLVYGTPANRDTVTVGYQSIYIAQPDPVYHGSYNSGGSWALTADFTWVWTFFESDGTTPATSGAAADYVSAAGTKANEILVTWPTVGDYVLKVAEKAPVAFGGCEDQTPSVINIAVVDAPVRNTVPTGTVQYCGDQAAVNIVVNLSGFPAFDVTWALVQDNIDENGDLIGGSANTLRASAAQRVGTPNFTTRSTADYTLESRAFTLVGGERTRYTYTFGGINDLYSRKSDYVGGSTTWFPDPASDQTYIVIVNPMPATGPIFHVPNNWGN